MIEVTLTGLEEGLLREAAAHIQVALRRAEAPFRARLAGLVLKALKDEPEGQSLLSSSPDSLHGQLGVEGPEAAIKAMADALAGAMSYQVTGPYYAGGRLQGGLDIGMASSSLQEVLSLPEAQYGSEGGKTVEWLNWLLLRGATPFLRNWRYEPAPGKGRTGLGHMVSGGAWGVPSRFAGVLTENWVVRAIEGLGEPLAAALESEVSRHV